jgi:transposase InsO family protein
VYCRLRLNLPRRARGRVPQRERQPLLAEPRTSAVRAIDFKRDTLSSGRVFRALNVIDEANRGALGIDVAVSIPAARVSAFLVRMIDLHGRPSAIRCGNGPELTSQPFTDWCKEQDIELRFILPGKPDQGRLRRTLQSHLPRRGAQRLSLRLAGRSPRNHHRVARARRRGRAARRAGKPAASALPRAGARRGNSGLGLST